MISYKIYIYQQVQVGNGINYLDEAVFISLDNNTLKKGMIPSLQKLG